MVKKKKRKTLKTVLLLLLSAISLCGCSLSLCFSMGLGINRSSEAIVPEVKKFYHTRGSYGYIVAKFDSECKSNNLSFYKRLLSLQEKYPSSHKNTFVQGRIFTIFNNDNRNKMSIGGRTDFSLIGIPEMKNISYIENEETVSYDVSYVGTALSKDFLGLGYSGINDASCFYASDSFGKQLENGGEESTISLNQENIILKYGGVIGPKKAKAFDRSSEISKISNKNFVFVNQNLFKYLNQSSIVFEISNSRQIDYDYTSVGANGKTKIEPLSFILDNYISDIVDFLNEFKYKDITIYRSVGNESSIVETNTDGTNKLQEFSLKYLEYYRNSKPKLYALVLFLSFVFLSVLWVFLALQTKDIAIHNKKIRLILVFFDCAAIILFLIPPFIIKNLRFFGLAEIKTFGIHFAIFSFIYLCLILLLTFCFFKQTQKELENK